MDDGRSGRRIDVMERRMEAWEARFDAAVGSLTAHISRLGERMGVEFSAIRGEMRAGDEALRGELADLRSETRAGHDALRGDLRSEIRAGDEALRGELADLRADMHIGDDETRHLMRVLHEDVIERIARLGEDR